MSLSEVRDFNFSTDYEAVLRLWQDAGEGIQLRRSDEADEILKKLQRDPDLFLVIENDRAEIIGAVFAGFDGRRGMMYHLAVEKTHRKMGVASILVEELENRLREKGCIRYYLLVTPENRDAIHFYENRDWEKLDLLVYGKDLE